MKFNLIIALPITLLFHCQIYLGLAETLVDDLTGWKDGVDTIVPPETCGGASIIGGSQARINNKMVDDKIYKKFTFTSPQTDIVAQFDFYGVDGSDYEPHYVTINGYIGLEMTHSYIYLLNDLCGNNQLGEAVWPNQKAIVKLPCAVTEVTITFFTSFDEVESDESFGFTNLKVTGTNRCPENCQCCSVENPGQCTQCSGSGTCDHSAAPLYAISDALELATNPNPWLDQAGANVGKYTCASVEVLGGVGSMPSNYMIRTFSFPNSQFYTTFFVKFRVYYIDNWAKSDFVVMMDGEPALFDTHQGYRTDIGTTRCGQVPRDLIQDFGFTWKSPKAIQSITIKVASNVDTKAAGQGANKGSWGLENMEIQAYLECKSDCLRCTYYRSTYVCLECKAANPGCDSESSPMLTDGISSYSGWKKDGGSVDAPTFDCSGTSYINGPMAGGTLDEISKTFTLTEAYYDFWIYLDVLLFDQWDEKGFYIFVNDKEFYGLSFFDQRLGTQVCGGVQGDHKFTISKQLSFDSSTKSLTIKIKSQLTGAATDKTFGIRNLQIHGFGKCANSDCEKCSLNSQGQIECTKCKSGSTTCKASSFSITQTGTYTGWKDVSDNSALTQDTSCGGIPMIPGVVIAGPPSIYQEFSFDTYLSEVSLSTTMYLFGVWLFNSITIKVNDEVAFTKIYYSATRTSHYEICTISGNTENPADQLRRIDIWHTLSTPSKNIKIEFIVEKSTSFVYGTTDPRINGWGLTNFDLTGINNCGTSCVNNFAGPICSIDKTCAPCASQAQCSHFDSSHQKCFLKSDGQNLCGECVTDADCPSTAPSCLLSKCENIERPECLSHFDCQNNVQLPACLNKTCSSCTADNQCQLFHKCNITTGVCFEEVIPAATITNARVTQSVSTASKSSATVTSVSMPSSPLVGVLLESLSIIQLFKFINIDYPQRLAYLYHSSTSTTNIVDIEDPLVEPVGSEFKRRPLEGSFEKYRYPSSFIVNMQTTFVSVLALIAGGLFFSSMHNLFIRLKKEKLSLLCLKVKELMLWNLVLVNVLSTLPDMYLSSIIFGKYVIVTNRLDTLDFGLCLMSNIGVFIILYYLVKKAIQRLKIRNDPQKLEEFHKKHSHISVVFQEFKTDNRINSCFFLLTMIKPIIFAILLASFIHYPVVVTGTVLAMQVANCVYIPLKQPFKKKTDNICTAVIETFVLGMLVMVLLVALDEQGEKFDRSVVTDMYLVFNYGVVVFFICFQIIMTIAPVIFDYVKYKKQGLTFKQILKKMKGSENNSKQFTAKVQPVFKLNELKRKDTPNLDIVSPSPSKKNLLSFENVSSDDKMAFSIWKSPIGKSKMSTIKTVKTSVGLMKTMELDSANFERSISIDSKNEKIQEQELE